MKALHIVVVTLGVLIFPCKYAFAQDVSGHIEQSSKTTPEEKISFADSALQEMDLKVREVSKMLETAERDKDMIRIQCLNKKLTTMRALLEVSESASVVMKQALASGENESAEHEYRKIAIALSKVQQFRAEAEACGGSSGSTGTTKIDLNDAAVTAEEEGDTIPYEPGSDYGDGPPPTSRFQ